MYSSYSYKCISHKTDIFNFIRFFFIISDVFFCFRGPRAWLGLGSGPQDWSRPDQSSLVRSGFGSGPVRSGPVRTGPVQSSPVSGLVFDNAVRVSDNHLQGFKTDENNKNTCLSIKPSV